MSISLLRTAPLVVVAFVDGCSVVVEIVVKFVAAAGEVVFVVLVLVAVPLFLPHHTFFDNSVSVRRHGDSCSPATPAEHTTPVGKRLDT